VDGEEGMDIQKRWSLECSREETIFGMDTMAASSEFYTTP
jgi:hypothetical protein